MFAEAIEEVGGFTRAVQFLTRGYKSEEIDAGTATLFFVNDHGDAVTCGHVARAIAQSQQIEQNYANFKQERDSLDVKNRKAAIKQLEVKYKYRPGSPVQSRVRFVDCADTQGNITIHVHGHYDLAILQFGADKNYNIRGHAIFAKDPNDARPGDYLCRLGYPFPEYADFEYDRDTDDIYWLEGETTRIPRFPIDGMFTRHLADQNGVYGIELSTPGLRGQSGGPLFDEDGIIFGMQFATHHLYLGFDMENYKARSNGQEKTLNNQPFLHVGQCIGSEVIKAFLREKDIEFFEE